MHASRRILPAAHVGVRTGVDSRARRLAVAHVQLLRARGHSLSEIGRAFASSEVGPAYVSRAGGLVRNNGRISSRPENRSSSALPSSILAAILEAVDEPAGFYRTDGTAICIGESMSAWLRRPESEAVEAEVGNFVRGLSGMYEAKGCAYLETLLPLNGHGEAMSMTGLVLRMRSSSLGLCILAVLRRARPRQRALEHVLRERFALTKKECRVALLIARGRSTREIAQMLSISCHTVKRHTEHIFLKLDAKSRVEVAARVLAIEPPGTAVG